VDRLTDWLEWGGHIYLSGEKKPIEQCESRIQACLDDRLGEGYWKSLTKAKRVHRNLY
jgi:sulfite reductase (NADPH) flavoprotein alpha-component